ncbi:hypothetical protein EX30DRAFT_114531 [Ascodesmis nigricans]|uniref:Transmembrane protein n=1 Tax=Ascodesmis nigricans TaxID=341454 RepID=A0A4S2MPX0_9PEZI|nr:hypothetical protein EX30DRAFT_114531 [Ascodesmis nigricans]
MFDLLVPPPVSTLKIFQGQISASCFTQFSSIYSPLYSVLFSTLRSALRFLYSPLSTLCLLTFALQPLLPLPHPPALRQQPQQQTHNALISLSPATALITLILPSAVHIFATAALVFISGRWRSSVLVSVATAFVLAGYISRARVLSLVHQLAAGSSKIPTRKFESCWPTAMSSLVLRFSFSLSPATVTVLVSVSLAIGRSRCWFSFSFSFSPATALDLGLAGYAGCTSLPALPIIVARCLIHQHRCRAGGAFQMDLDVSFSHRKRHFSTPSTWQPNPQNECRR